MPFTPAHAAAVIPFLKINPRYVSATGLIIGSMAPDFEYFFKFSVESFYSHSLWAILYFNIPVSVLLALLFHSIVKKNIIANFPRVLQDKFQHVLAFNFIDYLKKNPVAFAVSAAIGAASHIIWDSFTHYDAFFVRNLSIYEGTYFPFDGARYPLWYALQHISTIIGLLVLLMYVISLPRKKVIHKPSSLRYWFFIILITSFVVVVRFTIKSSDFNLGNFVVSSISGLCIGFIVCGFLNFNRDTVQPA
jgi:hypothetical protein